MMTKLGPYEVHPFADDFPLVEGDEFGELVLSIKEHGLRDPIVLTHDKRVLVDGRNRYRACEAAGVDPVFEALPERYTETMLLDFIADKNIKRRQITNGQRAFAGLKYEERLAVIAKEAIVEGGRKGGSASPYKADCDAKAPADLREPWPVPISKEELAELQVSTPGRREQESATRAAKAVGSSGRAVQQAKAIARDAPDLAEKVKQGKESLDAAYRQTRQRIKAMPKPEPAPKPSPVMLTLRTTDGQEIPYPQPKSKPTFNETSGDGISWAAWSWNPVTGCLHGCDYCYAREIATSERARAAYPVGFTPLFHYERLDAPANTTVPQAHRDDPAYRRVFVCSMADLYGRWVPDEWIQQVHASMLATPWWQYILLTKFPARYVGLDLPPKAWVGTSVDEQKRVRIAEDAFRQLDGVAVKWLSLEPLREPLEFTDLSMFDWVVIGAQTETRQPDGTVAAFAPPFEWVARIALQAKEAGCKVHLKPNLLRSPGMRLLDEYPDA
jgi:protein gp37